MISLDFGDTPNGPEYPTAAQAAEAACWAAARSAYAVAACLMDLAAVLVDLETYRAVHDAGTSDLTHAALVSVPLIGTTRDEQPRTPQSASKGPYAKASCAWCRKDIWAYGKHTDKVDVGGGAWLPGRTELTNWTHGTDGEYDHNPTPTAGSTVVGSWADEQGMGDRVD